MKKITEQAISYEAPEVEILDLGNMLEICTGLTPSEESDDYGEGSDRKTFGLS